MDNVMEDMVIGGSGGGGMEEEEEGCYHCSTKG